MAHRYVIKLMEQYSKNTGNPETVVYDLAFVEWLGEYKRTLQQLSNYYKSVGLNVDNPKIYETDKGLIDTIAYDFNRQITRYEDPYQSVSIYNNKPVMLDQRGKMFDLSQAEMIYTFNPYEKSLLEVYPRLNHVGQQIVISMIGKQYDKDKQAKINYLKSFKQRVLSNCKEDYIEDKDTYIYTVHSDKRPQTPTFGSARMR